MSGRKNSASTGVNVGYKARLWEMADALRPSMDAAEFKHVVSGVLFLKHISDAFEEQHAKREAERKKGADFEAPDEYHALNILWVPPDARWSHLNVQTRPPPIGKLVDDAMSVIEHENTTLKGVPSEDYVRPALDKSRFRQLIDLITNTGVGDAFARRLQTGVAWRSAGLRK